MYDELQPENEQQSEDDIVIDELVEIDEAEKLNEDSGKVILPKYGYYQVQRNAAPPENKKEKNGFGKKLLATVILAVVFGLVSGLVMTAVVRIAGNPAESSSVARTEPLNQNIAGSAESDSASQETKALPEDNSGSGQKETVLDEETVPDMEMEVTSKAAEENRPAAETAVGFSSLAGKGAVADVAAACMPSVVAITSVSIQEIPVFFGYGSQTYQSESSGSGIIIGENEKELLIATNNHVVSGASTLSVLFIGDDGASAQDDPEDAGLMGSIANDLNYEGAVNALVKGTDPENDLAVVAVSKEDIPPETMEKIKIAALGDSNELVVGEQVVAIGNALGYGQSVTSGWISALNRTITSGGTNVSDLIQTDAAINPGNSGGVLLNMNGEVIGINSAKYAKSQVEGMGYAIPISKASPILEGLMSRETRVKLDSSESGYMGISVADVSRETSWMYGIPQGAFVTQISERGAAYDAGLCAGDIIVTLDGFAIEDKEDLIDMLSYYRPGEEVEVVFYRKGRDGTYYEESVFVTMGARQ